MRASTRFIGRPLKQNVPMWRRCYPRWAVVVCEVVPWPVEALEETMNKTAVAVFRSGGGGTHCAIVGCRFNVGLGR